jgi:hypothetical protein
MSNKASLVPFKKGKDPRRNVNGANRGSKWLTTKLEIALTKLGDGNKEPYDELLVKRVMKKAIIEGDMRAVEHIWNRLEGGIAHALDITTGGKPFYDEEQKRLSKAAIHEYIGTNTGKGGQS